MSLIEILVVVAIIGFVIFQQVTGQAVQGKRLLLLPAIVTAIGFADLHGVKHLHHADYVWLAVGAIGSVAIGLAFGAITRISSRDGALWAKLPLWGLWLWVAMIGWRAFVMVAAGHTGAHVAASTTPLLFTLGLNRLAQGGVIAARAMKSGIPFAPEKDGRPFMSGAFNGGQRDRIGRY
jgi:hypothetical protein